MTTDEKAKAYEMALEAARKELGVDRKEWEVVQRVLHNIFPELAESEDERIRKELVAFFIEVRNREGNEGYWHDLKVADILAYLEQQKELTRENVIKELEKEFYACSTTPKWFHKTVQDAINIGKAEAFREIQKEYDRVREKEIADVDYGIAIEEWKKQKEQKPAEQMVEPHNPDGSNPYDMPFEQAQSYINKRGLDLPWNDDEVDDDEALYDAEESYKENLAMEEYYEEKYGA